jgi:hypothetical protein
LCSFAELSPSAQNSVGPLVMAPSTIDVFPVKVQAPSPQGLLRLTSSGGTEINQQGQDDTSPKPLFIRGASGHFGQDVLKASKAELDPEPAKLNIPWPSFHMDTGMKVTSQLGDAEEFACHQSQCSTEDPNEEASLPPYYGGGPVSGAAQETQDALGLRPGIPTKGSQGHNLGKCKPCAFVFKGGCESGVNCTFCHLCAPGEKKRRKKERKDFRSQTTNPRNTQVEAQWESQSEVQYRTPPPPPPPPQFPMLPPGLYDDLQEKQDAYPMPKKSSHAIGSKAWQLEKSMTRCGAPYAYAPEENGWYSAYKGL